MCFLGCSLYIIVAMCNGAFAFPMCGCVSTVLYLLCSNCDGDVTFFVVDMRSVLGLDLLHD